MALTLEDKIYAELLELGDGDEFRREQIVESFAENATNDFMDEIGLKTDESFALIYKAVLKSINKELDWSEVDSQINEARESLKDWFDSYMEAVLG
jgi:uncharacterized protein YpuA (DUF1002 family)